MKKIWHVFVKTHLSDHVLHKISSLTDLKKSLLQLLKSSDRFVNLINRNVDVQVPTVKWAFGKINVNFNSLNFTLFNLTFDMYYCYQLNLTFDEIFFSSSTCYLGKLSISQSAYKRLYEFCGYHSLFNLYPQDSLLYIKFILREGESVRIQVSFTIFDHEIVYSMTEINFYFEAIQPIIFHKFESLVRSQLLATYFIQTKVTSQIKLKFMLQANVQHLLHDGPSISFHVRRVTRSIYIMSTHQCALQTLHLSSVKNQTSNFRYTSLPLNASFVQLHEYAIYDSVSLPMEWCQKSHCLIRIQSKHKTLQVNITITKITSDIIHNPKCIYGGLVIGEQMYDNQQEYQTLCENHDGSNTLSKSVYSSNSSLFIVLYWYNSIGQISTSLSISETPCKPLFMDDCRIATFYGNEKNESRCLSYLNSITAYTDVQFEKCDEQWPGGCSLYLSSTKKTSCTIVQFIRKDLNSKLNFFKGPNICRNRLIIDLFSDVFTTARYEFKKSFGPLPSSWPHPEGHDEMVSYGSFEHIALSNESIVRGENFEGTSPFTLMFLTSIHRQRHSWIEMKLNISDQLCVVQTNNTGLLLFYLLNSTRTQSKCPEQTLIMKIPELKQQKKILLEIYIKSYQDLALANQKKEMMYWIYCTEQYKVFKKEIIYLKFLHWSAKIKPIRLCCNIDFQEKYTVLIAADHE